MTSLGTRRMMLLLLLLLSLFFTGCGKKEESRWQAAQDASESNAAATSEESLKGSSFNALFPTAPEGFEIVFTQEKTGFAEAKLKKDGTDVALLSISDTVNNPEAKEKYQESSEVLAGFPVADVGSKGTAILVADRFQVQVRSTDDSFSQFDREDWLQKFNLDTLSGLQQ